MNCSKFYDILDQYYRYFISRFLCLNKTPAYQQLDDFDTVEYTFIIKR